MGGITEHRSMEGMGDGYVLEPRHKIFLSHSGAQKEFVEHLCEALERRHRFPFFDKRCSSLPKGERFPELILKAAKQCQVAVVVFSDEYFMSKWPMIELQAFMHAVRQKSNIGLKVLPLFYQLSVSEFHDGRRRERWFNQWESFAKDDVRGQIKISEWKDALDMLGSFNGISYNHELQEIMAYQNEIVTNICNFILPDVKWDDLHVQRKSSIYKVITEKIQEIGASDKYEVDVVGIYGVGGIGKTTLCKIMCNELSNEYEDRVCHVEFESKNSNFVKLLRKVLTDLTSTRLEALEPLNEGQCMDILRKTLSKNRTFLALDNIWDDYQSIKQAKMFLDIPFHKESLVMVTARSEKILELLGIKADAVFEMPELGQADAMNLFLYHAAPGKHIADEQDKHDIMMCVQQCYFKKGDTEGSHYHPLALEALGLQLGCLGEKPSEWVKKLSNVRNFSYFGGENPVFAVLRNSFDLLLPTEQSLFMDVVFYKPILKSNLLSAEIDLMEWLCFVYKEDEHEIKNRLHRLKRKGLLRDVDLESGTISIHDLYREFGEMELKGKLDESTDLENRRWVYVDNGDLSELQSTPSGRCWQKLIRLDIHQEISPPPDNPIESLEGIEWQYFSNVAVLKLHGLRRVRGALNLERLNCLRSLQLNDMDGLERLEGLEGLKNLACFIWSYTSSFWTLLSETFPLKDEEKPPPPVGPLPLLSFDSFSPPLSFDFSKDWDAWNGREQCYYGGGVVHTLVMGQFPASLKVLHIHIGVMLRPDVLARCNNLCTLVLYDVRAGHLDLSNCTSLRSVTLDTVRNLRILYGFTARWASKLKSLEICLCMNLNNIPGLDHLVGLERLRLNHCLEKGLPDLQNLTKLQVLDLSGQEFLAREGRLGLTGLCIPQQLRELRYRKLFESMEAPNLNGFEQLQVLDLSSCKLTCMEALEDLPALRCLDLSNSEISSRLPDLNKSRNLEELILDYTTLDLHEEDICMLGRLPLLQPVPICSAIRFDLVRRRVLKHMLGPSFSAPRSWLDWKEDEWEESDLGIPPLRIDLSTRTMQYNVSYLY